MKNKRKKLNRVASLILVLLFGFINSSSVFSLNDTYTISTTDDYFDLVSKCRVDSFSVNKTVKLLNDIDFTGIKFEPIPIFCGTFLGNCHTLKGIKLESKGSYKGVFRYVQDNAVIDSLNVEGDFLPDGSKSFVGAIAGENRGTIRLCSFEGNIKGEASVGGVCGYVTTSGSVVDCEVRGTIDGNSFTGGIVGQNYGVLSGCINRASVNTTQDDEEDDNSLEDLEGNVDVDLENLRSTENIDAKTDTGGVCGYSKGTISKCSNFGEVGYKSAGYNVGGICGRSAGILNDCENSGTVNGRKDVGGVLGQAEPFIKLEYSGDLITDMRSTLLEISNILNGVNSDSINDGAIDKMSDINDSFSKINKEMDGVNNSLGSYTTELSNSIYELSNKLSRFADDINPVFDILSKSLKSANEGLKCFADCSDELGKLSTQIEDIAEKLSKNDNSKYSSVVNNLEQSMHWLTKSTDYFEYSYDSISDDLDAVQESLKDISEDRKNIEKQKEDINKAWESIGNVSEDINDIASGIEAFEKALEKLKASGIDIPDSTLQSLKKLAEAYFDIAKALVNVNNGLFEIAEDFDFDSFGSGIRNLNKGIGKLKIAFNSLKSILDDDFGDFSENAGEVSKNIGNASKYASNGLAKLKDGVTGLSEVSDIALKAVDDFNDGYKLSIPKKPESLDGQLSNINDYADDIVTGVSGLSNYLKKDKKTIMDNLQKLSEQLELMSNAIEEDESIGSGENFQNIFEDVSDSNLENNKNGKTENCRNNGKIVGDINVGGIIGSMAIEYDFDPEDDATASGEKSLTFKYKTKCTVNNCSNYDEVNVKNNYGGGICGRMELGCISNSENYGTVKSEEANYVGGIAGESVTIIRGCASKCTLEGKDYVGGVVGDGKTITNCRTIVHISSDGEYIGTIAGKTSNGTVKYNYYVSDSFGGIDNISYKNVAEECGIGDFVKFVKSSFGKDVKFTINFIADDKLISTVDFNYGDEIPSDSIPSVPEKMGYYGKWSEYDFSNATYDAEIIAEYTRSVEMISSDELRENNRPVLLLLGTFDNNAEMVTSTSTDSTFENTIEARRVRINGVHLDEYKLRYLPKTDNNNYTLYIDYGNGAEKITHKKVGSYDEIMAKSPNFTLYEVENNFNYYIIILVLVLAMIIIVFIIIKFRKKSCNKHSKKEG